MDEKNEIAQSSRPEQIEPFIWQTLLKTNV